jgi:protein subunit release factor A
VVLVVALEQHDASGPRLDKCDVRVDVYRDTGPGGQHRNKTESAVRLTHLPSGTVVTAVEDRSQHVNRKVAFERLEARLSEVYLKRINLQANQVRRLQLESARSYTWTGWRDTVTGSGGQSASMKRALAGRLDPLLE